MVERDVVQRVRSYFERQLRWLEDALAALEVNGAAVEDEMLARLERAQQDQRAALETFQREQQGLLREWRQAAVSSADRQAVQALAARAQSRAETLGARYAALAEQLENDSRDHRRLIDELRQGQSMLKRYGAQAARPPELFDRKA